MKVKYITTDIGRIFFYWSSFGFFMQVEYFKGNSSVTINLSQQGQAFIFCLKSSSLLGSSNKQSKAVFPTLLAY